MNFRGVAIVSRPISQPRFGGRSQQTAAGGRSEQERVRMAHRLITPRTLLRTAATTALAAPFVRGAYAAGSLSVGFWDHWVPGANDTLTKLCNEWAAKEKVDIKIDYITSQADKLNLTQAAEAQAKSGHDML